MTNYECTICKFLSSNKKDYNRHLITKKHIINTNSLKKELHVPVKNNTPILLPKTPQNSAKLKKTQQNHKYICEYCKNIFTRSNNLTRHLKICANKDNEIIKLKSKLEQFEKDNCEQYEKIKFITAENNYHKQMLNEAGGIVKKSVSALTYIMNNYGSAPTIEMLDVDDLEDLEQNNKKLVEDVLSAHRHKTIDKYLGDSIKILYKKDKPENQSVWSTDTSRLTYLIKELMVNNSSNWVIDKKGTKTKEYLIDPLLEHIKNIVINYQKNSANMIVNAANMEYILETNKQISKLINDIDDGLVGNLLLKYISSHLFFNEKLLK